MTNTVNIRDRVYNNLALTAITASMVVSLGIGRYYQITDELESLGRVQALKQANELVRECDDSDIITKLLKMPGYFAGRDYIFEKDSNIEFYNPDTLSK